MKNRSPVILNRYITDFYIQINKYVQGEHKNKNLITCKKFDQM